MIRVDIRSDRAGQPLLGHFEVMRAGRFVGLESVDEEGNSVTLEMDSDELAKLVSALVTVQAEVIAQNGDR